MPLNQAQNNNFITLSGITKYYGATQALHDVSLSINRGEIIGVLGDNGSGKTTLISIISGFLAPDKGSIYLWGKKIILKHPRDAIKHGIRTIYQDMGLCPCLTVFDNIYLGQEKIKKVFGLPLLDKEKMKKSAIELLSKLQADASIVTKKVSELSGGQKKAVALARLLVSPANLLLFDEPTAALGVRQRENLLESIKNIKQNSSVIFVSHNPEDILAVADRVRARSKITSTISSHLHAIFV